MEVTRYRPPPTLRAFIRDYLPHALFYDWVIGPLGAGKTTALFFKLVYMAQMQAPSPDGIRRTRAVVVRNTAPQLRDTTIVSWNYWFKDGIHGKWKATEKNFLLKFGDVECEVMFRALDTPDDVARVLSLEITFAILDEFSQIGHEIVDALAGRLGRYPTAKDGGATNWGMWGSSNPDTEDNWWFDYLNDAAVNERIVSLDLKDDTRDGRNARYFHQPSGFSAEAENVENLPGKSGYYQNLAIGKTTAWIKQFIESEWGFSAAGKPVVAIFRPESHVSRKPLLFQPAYPLVAGLDPGLEGTGMVFGQEDLNGRLLVLGELYAEGMGTTRFITEKLKPYLRHRFPNAGQFIINPDPAAGNRAQTDEVPIVAIIKKEFGSSNVPIESNNRLPLRLEAIDDYAVRNTELGPALLIDAQACPMLIRALGGGWRFEKPARGSADIKATTEKNSYSHIGDAFGYLCRYFARQYQRSGAHGRTVLEQRAQRPQCAPIPRYNYV